LYHGDDYRLPIFKSLKSMDDTPHNERKKETIETLSLIVQSNPPHYPSKTCYG